MVKSQLSWCTVLVKVPGRPNFNAKNLSVCTTSFIFKVLFQGILNYFKRDSEPQSVKKYENYDQRTTEIFGIIWIFLLLRPLLRTKQRTILQ